jgi:hypothetical protein
MLDALGNLGDFVGGLAVVVTLIYLAVQVRQNTAALRTASWQTVVSTYRESNRLRTDPRTALAWARGVTGFPDLPFEQRSLFSTVMVDEALCLQGAFALHEAGQLEDATYQAYLTYFASVVSTPGGARWWEIVGRPIFLPAMVETVDRRVAAGGLLDLSEMPGLRVEDVPVTEGEAPRS